MRKGNRGRSRSKDKRSTVVDLVSTGITRQSSQSMDGDTVKLKVTVRRISDVDTYAERCYVDMWVCAFDSKQESSTAAFQDSFNREDSKDIFDTKFPKWKITFINAEDISYVYQKTHRPSVRWFKEENTFYERLHVRGYFNQKFDASDFPFDKQTLKIKISLDVNVKRAKFGDVLCQLDEDNELVQNTEWHKPRSHPVATIHGERGILDPSAYSTCVISLPIERKFHLYFFSVVLPLLLIVCAAQIPMFQKASDIHGDGKLESLDYLGTLFLAVVAFRWSLVDKMPPLCILDNMFIFAYFNIFFQMILQVSELRGYFRRVLPSDVSGIIDSPWHLEFATCVAFILTVLNKKIRSFLWKSWQRLVLKKEGS